MEDIQLEVVIIDEKFGEKKDPHDLVQEFLSKTNDRITARCSKKVDEEGNVIEERMSTYQRKCDIFWTSIAILLISNPEGVVQFLKWASDYPGLTMGLTMEGDSRIKIFSESDFTLIDNSDNYNITRYGEADGSVVVEMSEEDWYALVDDIETDEMEVELPPEDRIGP